MMSKLRAQWLVVAHDLLEYRYMNDVTDLFSLLCSTRFWKKKNNVFANIPLWASEDVENFFEETIYKYDKQKRRSRDESSVRDLKMPKLAQILESVRRFKAGKFIGLFSDHWRHWNRFHVAVGLLSNRSQKTSKCVKITAQVHGNMESIC